MPIGSIPDPFLLVFQSFDEFLIIGHEDPDGDCLGSQIALASFLNRSGKRANALSSGPFRRAEINDLADRVADHVPPMEKGSKRAAVIVDCSSIDRVGYLAKEIEGLPTLILDHHASGGDPVASAASCIDPGAPSVTYLTLLLIEGLGGIPTNEEAQLLLFGLATDTGFFRHVTHGGEEILSVASRLCRYGAVPKDAYQTMYGNRSLVSKKLIGRVLDRAQPRVGGKVLTSYLTVDDEKELGFGERDSDTIYGQLQAVAGVDAVLFFRDEEPGEISVGLRSNLVLDVGAVAQQFGGGGHKHAASFRSREQRNQLERKLLSVIETMYS
jgi:phosphoesterase RecJ-like protein